MESQVCETFEWCKNIKYQLCGTDILPHSSKSVIMDICSNCQAQESSAGQSATLYVHQLKNMTEEWKRKCCPPFSLDHCPGAQHEPLTPEKRFHRLGLTRTESEPGPGFSVHPSPALEIEVSADYIKLEWPFAMCVEPNIHK